MAVRAPASADEALEMLHASLDLLAGIDWQAEGGRGQGLALRSLGAARAKWTVAHAGALTAFGSCGGYAADGHPSLRTWLRHQAKLTRLAARDLDVHAGRLAAHPLLREALAGGEVSDSWAWQLAAWNDRLPADQVDAADAILLDATRANLPLHPDIARLAQAIYEAVRGQCPDSGPDDDGFRDRDIRMGTTLGGAGRLKGDLSAQCAALLAQVFAAFGKNAGPGDLRGPGQRNHDALEIALRLALGAPGIPGNSGMKTRAQAVMSLADLLAMDGASAVQEAWLAARAGEPGWFCGPAARATACAAQVTPVVTGSPDWYVLSEMADIFLEAHGFQQDASQEAAIGEHGIGEHGIGGHAITEPEPGIGKLGKGDQSTGEHGTDEQGHGAQGTREHSTGPRSCGCTCGGCDCPPPGLRGSLSPAARVALVAMSIRALSGPEGLAGFLRARLLGRPFNGASMVLDIGSTDDIPDHIRRAVILRDRHCQWPGGCDRPASQCEPHHLRPRADGGETSVENLRLYCLVHHHHFIHRLGWQIIHHPDGTRDAISPSGKVTRSHPLPAHGQGPPGQRTRGSAAARGRPPDASSPSG
jgi:hypothetical protein